MKIKTILLISLIILVISISFIQFNIMEEKEITKEKVFQGPVRPGDDEAHFRKTGITRPLEQEGRN